MSVPGSFSNPSTDTDAFLSQAFLVSWSLPRLCALRLMNLVCSPPLPSPKANYIENPSHQVTTNSPSRLSVPRFSSRCPSNCRQALFQVSSLFTTSIAFARSSIHNAPSTLSPNHPDIIIHQLSAVHPAFASIPLSFVETVLATTPSRLKRQSRSGTKNISSTIYVDNNNNSIRQSSCTRCSQQASSH